MTEAEELCLVSATVVHEDDWTVYLEGRNPREMSISSLSHSVLSSHYDQEASIVRTVDKAAYADLVRSLKSNPSIRSTETLCSAELRRVSYFLISVVARSDASIFSLITKYGGIPVDVHYSQGMEHWKFMCGRSRVRGAMANISGMATVKRLQLDAVSPSILESLMNGEAIMSQREFSSTLAAYRMGYFDYPKGMDLTEVAVRLELSKATVHEYIRKGVLKILRKEFGLLANRDTTARRTDNRDDDLTL
jgi:predicted DNA binding protein